MWHLHANVVYNHHSCQIWLNTMLPLFFGEARGQYCLLFLSCWSLSEHSIQTFHFPVETPQEDPRISVTPVYVYLWRSLSIWTLDMVFWYNFEVNTKCSDIVNFAQWPHVRFSTPATGATVTWSTSVLCLLELGPSFSINNSADLILSFRRIKRQFTLEYVCMTN